MADREEGYYWVRPIEKIARWIRPDGWEPALYDGGKWWLTTESRMVHEEEILEVGQMLAPPENAPETSVRLPKSDEVGRE